MAGYIKILSGILGFGLLALVWDVGFDQRPSELMGIPTTSFTPTDYRGITGLFLLLGIVMLIGLVVYCGAVHVRTWSKATAIAAVCSSSIAVGFLWLMLDFHAMPQMIEVSNKLIQKLGRPSTHPTAPVPQNPVETGTIPIAKKPSVAKKKPDPEPSFFTNPWAWLQWNNRKNEAECGSDNEWKPAWCKNFHQ